MQYLQLFFHRNSVIGAAYAGLYDYDDDLNDKSIEEVKGSFLQKRHFLEKDVKFHPCNMKKSSFKLAHNSSNRLYS